MSNLTVSTKKKPKFDIGLLMSKFTFLFQNLTFITESRSMHNIFHIFILYTCILFYFFEFEVGK